MTLKDIEAMDKPTITPAEAGAVLGCAPHYIRLQARSNPHALGFPVIVIGSRCHIPRLPFIRYIRGA